MLGMALPAQGQQVLIRDAAVYTQSERGVIEHADVLVRDGTIAAVGTGLQAPARATVIDGHNQPLTPGLFGGLSQLGLDEVALESSSVDSQLSLSGPAAAQPWRPEFDVTLAYNPRSVLVPVARIEGITWSVLTPSNKNSIVAGRGAAVTLDGRFDAVLGGSRSLFVSLGSQGKSRAGGSRAAEYMLLQQAFREVRDPHSAGYGALLHPAGREALAPFLAGGRIVFQVERAADIHELIEFSRQNGLNAVISGGSEAWVVADELARARIPVILDPLENLPEGFDEIGARLDNAALLNRAGVRIAFSADDDYNARNVRQLAGNAVAHGLPWDSALAAITAVPADIFGLGTRRGRIAVGQSADLVLWSGDPLEVTTQAERVWIAGRAQPLRSRQTELRDRYLGKER
jgi:hypothetical protein